ncbi:MAG: hypothetical protein RRA32_05880 [bacterium]|nr:hypothetical protein [bacterium]
MTGSVKILVVLSLALLAASYGCGNPLDSSSTDGTSLVPAPLGMDLCYECHAPTVFTVFEEWLVSRHSNFDYYDAEDGRPNPLDSSTFGDNYATIVGDPHYLNRCDPCHLGPIDQGNTGTVILSALNAAGTFFTNPNLGQVNRPLIDCESCHVSGAGHWRAASPPYVTTPAFAECTECHPPFEGGVREEHHSLDGYRYWFGPGGDNLKNSRNVAIASTVTIAQETFEVWTAPNASDWIQTFWKDTNDDGTADTLVNLGAWLGPYAFDGFETISDTHFNEIWIAGVIESGINSGSGQITRYTSPTAMFGYVDLANTSPNTGMTRADSEDACTASCHGAHEFDLTINEQWFEGAHHPMPVGPVVAVDSTEADPSGPSNWGAVDHGFRSSCLRCHNSMGFAEVAPGYGSAVLTPSDSDGFITCNACHDGVDYPTAGNKHMRFSGSVALFDYRGKPLAYVEAGNSAVCVYCHQGRQDDSHVALDASKYDPAMMETSTYPSYMTSTRSNPVVFRNMHYLASAAVLYAEKGYEYAGSEYSGEHIHAALGCVRCHMAEEPGTEEVGGHTFHMAHGSTEATTYCAPCHPSMAAIDNPWGTGTDAANDVAYMLTVLLNDAIEAYDSPDDADTTAQVYFTESYPYFILNESAGGNTSQGWDPPLAEAAFNWQFIKKDPGAYAHNWKYAVQLLYDSYKDLRFNDGSIPALAASVTRP